MRWHFFSDQCYEYENIFAKEIGKNITEKSAHNIWFREKNRPFFAKNWQKSPIIAIITLTPGSGSDPAAPAAEGAAQLRESSCHLQLCLLPLRMVSRRFRSYVSQGCQMVYFQNKKYQFG
jgi:hypothetical protein